MTPMFDAKSQRLGAGIALLGAIALGWAISYCACATQGSPKREAEDKAFVVLEKTACVLIVAEDPELASVCAKADELAPLVPVIMARRAKDAGPDGKGD